MQLGGLVKRCMRFNTTSFVRISRPFGPLRCLTYRRNLEKSGDCDSRAAPETDPCSIPEDDDDSCPPCPSQPPYLPPHDPRKLSFWRMLSLCVALPLILVLTAVTYARKREKLKQPREPFRNLTYMCRRTKPFPWGDGNHTLFHNPVRNPVPPHGYEVEDPYALPKKAGN